MSMKNNISPELTRYIPCVLSFLHRYDYQSMLGICVFLNMLWSLL